MLRRPARLYRWGVVQPAALTLDETAGHLDADAVAAGAAGVDLVQQFTQLRSAGGTVVDAAQPVAQQVGLAVARKALNARDQRCVSQDRMSAPRTCNSGR